jgi:hypothetical protein
MRQLIYSMRFTGHAAPIPGSPSVMKATTTATSCQLTTIAGTDGVQGNCETVSGDTARFESEVTVTGETSFLESGTISFGTRSHGFSFSTVGQGYLADSAQPGLKHGTVTWRVDNGEGQFAGASGLITSNFTIGEAGEVTDYHFGLIFVR